MTKKEDDKNLRKKDAKNLEIFLLTLPDVDDLIKDTFYFLKHPSRTRVPLTTYCLWAAIGTAASFTFMILCTLRGTGYCRPTYGFTTFPFLLSHTRIWETLEGVIWLDATPPEVESPVIKLSLPICTS